MTKNPNLLTARLALAQAYMKNGRFADAVAQYDQILIVAPDAAEALLGRGSAEIALDRLDAAAPTSRRSSTRPRAARWPTWIRSSSPPTTAWA